MAASTREGLELGGQVELLRGWVEFRHPRRWVKFTGTLWKRTPQETGRTEGTRAETRGKTN